MAFSRLLDGLLAPATIVLMYHRVAELGNDPWGLAVSPARFVEQMRLIAADFEPVRLADVLERPRRLRRRPRVAVTFDDGYADNLETALPVMARFAVPATFFLSAGQIGSPAEFWWDALERIVFESTRLPDRIELTTDRGETLRVDLSAAGDRRRRYLSLWESLQRRASDERDRLLAQLHELAQVDTVARASHRVLDEREARQLAADDLFEVGAHAVSHAPLSALAEELQREEIERSRNWMRERFAVRRPTFAYPHGDHDATTRALVAAAGFTMACSTRAARVGAGVDRWAVPRCGVGDWGAAELRARLRWWLRAAE